MKRTAHQCAFLNSSLLVYEMIMEVIGTPIDCKLTASTAGLSGRIAQYKEIGRQESL